MAVAISKQTTPAGVNGSGNTVTFSGAAIGTASNDRMVVVTPTSEDATATIVTKVTVAGIPLVKCVSDSFNSSTLNASAWWGNIGTGTTADIIVTYTGTAPTSGQNLISIFAVTGAEPSLSAFTSDTSTDMDATSPLSAATTVPANGGIIGVAAGATNTSAAKAWGGNITEAEEVAVGGYCHTTATGTTSGATTITVQGGNNAEDGVLVLVVFAPATGKPPPNRDWTAPRGFAPLNRTWVLASRAINTGVTVDTTNLPSGVSDWGPPQPGPPSPQAWAGPRNIPLNEVVAAPFRQTDWPLPKGFATGNGTWVTPSRDLAPPFVPNKDWSLPSGFATKNGTWINPGIKDAATAPFNKTDWSTPRDHQRGPVGFAHSALPRFQDTNTYLPSAASGWPDHPALPKPLSFTVSRNLPLNTVVAAPFAQYDWQRPSAQTVSLSTWINPGIQTQTAPFRQNDWPRPRAAQQRDLNWFNGLPPIQFVFREPFTARRDSPDYRIWINSLPRANLLPFQPVPPAPFAQYDWPLPRAPQRNAAHQAWVYSSPPVNDTNTYLPSVASGWPGPQALLDQPLSFTASFNLSLIEVVEPPPDFPPHEPPTDSGGAGIKSGVWKPGKRANYRSYRFLTDKQIEQLTGTEIRQSARDLRADIRKDPFAEEVGKELLALSRIVNHLADIDRLEASVAELSRAIEYARQARAEADAEDEEISFLLLS